MKINTCLFSFTILFGLSIQAQEIKLPAAFSQAHPRLQVNKADKDAINQAIRTGDAARRAFDQLKAGIDVYVTRHETDSSWMVSRLQMYWKTKSTEVYIRGGVYDHAEGTAPVPTVRFPGSRGGVTVYAAPKLEDILPYMDDPRGAYLINRSKPGQPLEWTDISNTSGILDGINKNIMGMANTAALVYFISGEEKYARFAYDLFNTYMTGMYYRQPPKDVSHGHHETIGGLSTFEVIQETPIINSITGIYDCLYDYIQQKAPANMPVYTAVLRKWADVQIDHGVAFNNWDLIEARNILTIASVLEDNHQYPDGKGRQYYIDFVLNKNVERQWSIRKLLEGYDADNGLWSECPGYSMGVLGDFTELVRRFDRQFHHDLLPDVPILQKAVLASAQYLFPNGFFTSFGDSHYGRLSTAGAANLVANAQQHGKKEQEAIYTRYIKTINELNSRTGQSTNGAAIQPGRKEGLAALLPDENNVLNASIAPGHISDYVTPVFSAPHVSYFALRNGFHPVDGLMVAMSGSKGNHMHAGGISMEIFGKGMVLGPESGIGTNYFQQDYAEYYSQFPAHNTVAVDGISAYPVMKSNHGFEVKHAYPASGVKEGYFPAVSFGDLIFLEPETQSDQDRLTSIIRTSDTTGYYVDVFRSKRRDGKDKMHDYFYHNMGQQVTVNDASGKPLVMQPTEELSFSGGHLFAYDYFWDKQFTNTAQDVKAVFNLAMPGKDAMQMNMWIKGAEGRKIFSVKAPKSRSVDRMGLPESIAELPLPTIIARQSGEAWTKPFVVVFEPSTTAQPASIRSIQSFTPTQAPAGFTGLIISGKAGDLQTIFADAGGQRLLTQEDRSFQGTYAVISEAKEGLQYLFLGNGQSVAKGGYSIKARAANTSAALCRTAQGWSFTASAPVTITLPATALAGKTTITYTRDNKTITIPGKRMVQNKQSVFQFDLPAMSYTSLQ
ncbi:heparinase II/III family protein [Paraflavitalea soli]|nr:heparinase II/III family protein [Paraflavitalea soli]